MLFSSWASLRLAFFNPGMSGPKEAVKRRHLETPRREELTRALDVGVAGIAFVVAMIREAVVLECGSRAFGKY